MDKRKYENKLLKEGFENKLSPKNRGILLSSVAVEGMEFYPNIPKSYNGRLIIEFTTTGDFSEFEKDESRLKEAILKAAINLKKIQI